MSDMYSAGSPFNPRNRPLCERCGHGSGSHGATFCSHDGGAGKPRCDCPGWKRDEGWPATEKGAPRE